MTTAGFRLLALMGAAIAVMTIVAVAGPASPSLADKGGCPNAASQGKTSVNDNSAHGTLKQAARSCATPTPTPTPTPAGCIDFQVGVVCPPVPSTPPANCIDFNDGLCTPVPTCVAFEPGATPCPGPF